MVRTQVQLTEEQTRSLKKIASKRHVSLAELIRQGVNSLIRSSGDITAEERKNRAIAAAGRFRSGKRNISAIEKFPEVNISMERATKIRELLKV